MNPQNQEYDCIIAGTGPGGGTVARELASRGKRVLILEWGPGRPIRGNFIQYLFEQLVPGRSLLLEYRQMLGMVRGITTGGSSLFYYGTCFPVPHKMLKKYGIDITKEEKEARKDLPIAPLKQEMITPMAGKIMESARELGYDWKPLEKFMYQERWKPGMKFGYYGDPHNVKWSSKMYIDDALENGAVMINRAKVTNVILNGNKAVGVEFRRGLRKYRAFAPEIVIAAGGIGSPVILRKMGIKQAGRDFFYDPLITVCGKVKDVKKRADEIPMTAGCHFGEEGIVMTDMSIPSLLDKIFTSMVFRFHRLFESKRTLRIMIKIRDDLRGHLTDRGGVRKMLSKNDKAKLLKGYGIARDILKNAGATGIFRTWYLAAHPGGTVKIGELLDSDLRVKGYDNLYVCDCSVIPEPWGLPPTMTIISLGRRLAKHLLGTAAKKDTGKKKKGKIAAK